MTAVLGRAIADTGIVPAIDEGIVATARRARYAVIAVSPSTAVAVLARRSNSTQPGYYFGVIHERPRITTAARCLLRQLGPEPAGG